MLLTVQLPATNTRATRPTAGAAATRWAWRTWAWLLLALLVAAFGIVRLLCCFNDLWLDEIWTLNLLAIQPPIHSPIEILTRLRNDNNHPLNTLFIYYLGPDRPDWTYRLLSCVSGAAAVWLAGLIGGRQYRLLHPKSPAGHAQAAGLLAATLIGGCYLLIHYSSEARGYAPAVCLSLLAFYALLRGGDNCFSPWTIVYWLACVLAIFAHSAAAVTLIAGLGWTLMQPAPRPRPLRRKGLELAYWHLLPVAAGAAYWLLFVRTLAIGGGTIFESGHLGIRMTKLLFARTPALGAGPAHSLAAAMGELSAYCFGLPIIIGNITCVLIFGAIAIAGLIAMWRRNRALALFYALAMLLLPLIAPWTTYRTALYPRHLLLTAAWSALLGAYLLARLWAAGRAGRAGCLILLALFLAGNAWHTQRLLRYGRGQYRQALRYMAGHTAEDVLIVGSGQDFQNSQIIAYYAAAAGGKSVYYIPTDAWKPVGVEWLIVNRLDGDPAPAKAVGDRFGNVYTLVRIFPHAVLSGCDWCLYCNRRVLTGGQGP
jgi:hypothetical protein